jgi:hypothetical protein
VCVEFVLGAQEGVEASSSLNFCTNLSLAFDQQSPTMNALLSYIRFDVNSPPLSYVCIFLDRSTQKNKKMERALQRFSADLKGFTSKVADNVASLKRGAESRPYGGGERDGGAEGQLSAAR